MVIHGSREAGVWGRARDDHGRMSWEEVFRDAAVRVASRELLMSYGASGRMLTSAVAAGHLIRARRDKYLLPSEPSSLLDAVRIGGRLGCLSALEDAGIFVEDAGFSHVHLDHTMSRLRSPRSRFAPFTERDRGGAHLHWRPLVYPEHAVPWSVGVEDALLQSLRCQPPVRALASIDNALHLGMVSPTGVDRILASGPASTLWLRGHVDGRAEAGQETVLRMIAIDAGFVPELQVVIPGVGRVDMVVAGRLVLEADSRLAHEGWEHHVEDRRRDLALAAAGYMSLRPAYQHTMHNPLLVRSAILGLLQSR